MSASDEEVQALAARVAAVLAANPQVRGGALASLKALAEEIEDVATAPAGEDVADACLRRTQSTMKRHNKTQVAVDGMFDMVTMLRSLSEADLQRAEEAAQAAAAERGSLTPRAASVSDTDAAERALMTPNVYAPGAGEGLAQFKKGFLRFKQEVISRHPAHFAELAASQSPKVMVVACCDSRVDPALLMGAGPGDIFIVRNIANLVPPFERQGAYHGTSAALEYAVCALKVEHIVVVGHANCGGIKALMSRTDTACKNDFIDRWMEIASQACERTRLDAGHLPFAAQCSYCERESVNVSLANLLTFPWIKDAVARRTLQLHGWYYDMNEATMSTWKLRYQITDYEKLA